MEGVAFWGLSPYCKTGPIPGISLITVCADIRVVGVVVYVCMYVCMYACTYVCMHVYTYVYIIDRHTEALNSQRILK